MAEEVLLAFSTFPDAETARRIAHALISEKLAACANIIPTMNSIYRWKGKIETGDETIVFFKTTQHRYDAFQEKLRSLHPYEIPEIICVTIDKGLPDYLRWVVESCSS
jgi:periplasmic divalent cation tolerance protein